MKMEIHSINQKEIQRYVICYVIILFWRFWEICLY